METANGDAAERRSAYAKASSFALCATEDKTADRQEAIKRLDLLLEYAVMHNDEAEAARLRAALRRLTEEI